MPKKKTKIVVLTKEPLGSERMLAVKELSKSKIAEIQAVFIEDAVHLPLHKYVILTFKRIYKGHIYLPEFIENVISFVFKRNDGSIPYDASELKKMGIPIIRSKNIQMKSSLNKLNRLKPDLGLVIGHRILPKTVFSVPKHGMLNVHHGILPRYAGSHSTFWRMTEGFDDVGLTIHRISDKVDSGEILYIKKIKVKQLNSTQAYQKLVESVPEAVRAGVEGLIDGSLRFKKQKSSEYKYWKPPSFFERRKYRKLL